MLAIKSPPKRLLKDFIAFLKRKGGILTGPGRRYEELRAFEFVSLDTQEDPDRMMDLVEGFLCKVNIGYFKVLTPITSEVQGLTLLSSGQSSRDTHFLG